MKAAIIREHGSYDKILFEEISTPVVLENDVLIKVKAIGLNHLDTWVRRGVPGHKFPLPIVPGSDFTGVVERVGSSVSKFKKGDRVIVDPGVSCGECLYCLEKKENLCKKWGLLGESQNGACQEYVSVHEKQVHLLPPNLTFEQGAVIPVAYVTAWHMLVKRAKIKKGDTILIHSAGSGVSVAAIQIAKLFDCFVITTSTSDEKLIRAKTLGADRFINTLKSDFKESVKNLTNREGVDIVVDHIGEATFMDSIRCLKKGGCLVSCGATSGADIRIDWKHVFFKNLSLLGSTYGTSEDFKSVLELFSEKNSLFEGKKLVPVIDKTLPFFELPQAHELIETKKIFGKIIITF